MKKSQNIIRHDAADIYAQISKVCLRLILRSTLR